MEALEANPLDDLLKELCARLQEESDCTRAGVMNLFDRMEEVGREPYLPHDPDEIWKGEVFSSLVNVSKGLRHTITEWSTNELRGYYKEVNDAA